MSRPPRLFQPGLSAHVYHRGHNCATIFHEAADYQYFLELLRWAAIENELAVHSFAVMRNHHHLIATPDSATAISDTMKQLHGGYASYYNRKHNRLGTIWCGRYQAKPLTDEQYFWTCFTYVERNPVEAGIVDAPEDYPWSSYRIHTCGDDGKWLTVHPLYTALGTSATERQAAYRAIFGRCQTGSDGV